MGNLFSKEVREEIEIEGIHWRRIHHLQKQFSGPGRASETELILQGATLLGNGSEPPNEILMALGRVQPNGY